jgi:hypothetical protein
VFEQVLQAQLSEECVVVAQANAVARQRRGQALFVVGDLLAGD